MLKDQLKILQEVQKAKLAKVKLPKLVISANQLHWLRFWNEFNAEIKKSTLPRVSKFSYLKELLVAKEKVLEMVYHSMLKYKRE